MIYFVQAGVRGPVKIGKADDVAARVAGLSTAHYEALIVLATLDVPDEVERRLHKLLRPYCLRGEWFAWCPPVIAVVDLAMEGRLPDMPDADAAAPLMVIARKDSAPAPNAPVDPAWLAKQVNLLPVNDLEAVEIMRGLGHKISARTFWSIRKGQGNQTLASWRAIQALLDHFDRGESPDSNAA